MCLASTCITNVLNATVIEHSSLLPIHYPKLSSIDIQYSSRYPVLLPVTETVKELTSLEIISASSSSKENTSARHVGRKVPALSSVTCNALNAVEPLSTTDVMLTESLTMNWSPVVSSVHVNDHWSLISLGSEALQAMVY